MLPLDSHIQRMWPSALSVNHLEIGSKGPLRNNFLVLLAPREAGHIRQLDVPSSWSHWNLFFDKCLAAPHAPRGPGLTQIGHVLFIREAGLFAVEQGGCQTL